MLEKAGKLDSCIAFAKANNNFGLHIKPYNICTIRTEPPCVEKPRAQCTFLSAVWPERGPRWHWLVINASARSAQVQFLPQQAYAYVWAWLAGTKRNDQDCSDRTAATLPLCRMCFQPELQVLYWCRPRFSRWRENSRLIPRRPYFSADAGVTVCKRTK